MTHIIIPDYPTRVQFTVGATPTTGPWAFNFTFFATGDIDVYYGSALQTEGVNYTVTGNPGKEGGFEGGSITAVSPLSNTTVTVQRNIPLERVSDFPVAGSFNRQTLNTTLDKHVAMIQQVDERVDRAFILPPNSPPLGLVAGFFPRVNVAATGMELIAPTQVRTEIAAQPLDATLSALAALDTSSGQSIIVAIGADTFALSPSTPFGRTLHAQADAPGTRTTLGLGTMATQNSNAVNITGGTITGVAVAVPGLGTMSTQNANAVSITGGAITGMPMPVNPFDVATKNYADNLAFGVNKRSTVRVASTANLLISSVIGGSTLDGVVLAVSDRVLFKDQTNHAQNGVYLVGVATTSLRAADFDTYDECPGSLVTIQEGTVNQDTVWLCTSNAGGVLDTTPIDFTKVKVSPAIPVVIGEGGTGQITALAAFDALKQPAGSTYVGAVQLATQAEVNTGTDALKAVTPATLAGKLLGGPVRHDCRFDYINTTTCRLLRFGGNQITIDAQLRTIPAAGVDLAYNAGWGPAGTIFYVYAYMSAGAIALVADPTAPAIDARDGNYVYGANPSLTLVGMVAVGYGAFLWDQTRLGVISYWNRQRRSIQSGWAGVQTGSTAPVGLAATQQVLTWGDETIEVMIAGYGSNNGGVTAMIIDSYVDGAGSGGPMVCHCGGANYTVAQVTSQAKMLSPGWHNFTPYGYVSGGVGTWNGMQTLIASV